VSPRTEYDLALSGGAIVYARLDTEHGAAVSYAVTLVTEEEGELRAVRVYDDAHGSPEMHRYNRVGEKGPAEPAPGASASEGFNMALDLISDGFQERSTDGDAARGCSGK
jgi:hypothetical protein